MKRKVLLLIPSLEIGGGAERVASTLTIKLAQFYKIFIITLYNAKNIYAFNADYYYLNEDTNFWKKIPIIIKLYRNIRKISPDIIISFIDYTNILAIILKLIFKLKIPLIITVHANPKLQYHQKNRYLNLLIRLFYKTKATTQIVAISKEIKHILIQDYHITEDKIKTIYNGIEIDFIEKSSKEEISEYKNYFYDKSIIKFITVGRLIELKGHKYLIEAFIKFKKVVSNSKLFIIGDGPLKTQLKKLVKENNMDKDIFFLGLKKNPFKYLAKSDIFVLSSIREGLPTVILEALACGLPIISTNCRTGPKEILNNGRYGILVNVMDSEDLAKNMIELSENPSLIEQFRIKSKKRSEFFSIRQIINQWIEIIENNINRNKIE